MMVSSWRSREHRATGTHFLPEEQGFRAKPLNEDSEPPRNMPLRTRTRKVTKQFSHSGRGGVVERSYLMMRNQQSFSGHLPLRRGRTT